MNVWICDDFEGYWPVGTAAVIAAETEDEALALLDAELKEHGLPQSASVTVYRFSQDKPQAYIIRDGNY